MALDALTSGWKASAGDSVAIGGASLSASQVADLAKKHGWADPLALQSGQFEALTPRGVEGDGAGFAAGEAAHKIKGDWKTNNGEAWAYYTPASDEVRDEWGQVERPKVEGGYSVVAGELPKAKKYTRAFYDYDQGGKLKGMHFEADEKGLEGAAPIVGMLTAAFGAPLAASIGGGVNSALGLGLGATGSNVLGGALLQGGASVLTGGDFLKGAALGAITPAIKAINPAASVGVSAANQAAVNGLLGLGAKSVVSGKNPNLLSAISVLGGGWK